MSVKLKTVVVKVAMAIQNYWIFDGHNPITVEKACEIVESGSSLYVKWDPAWGLSANIDIDFKGFRSDKWIEPRVTVGWSTTTYTPAKAAAAAKFHAQVADLACLIESILDSEKIENPNYIAPTERDGEPPPEAVLEAARSTVRRLVP